MNRRIFFTSFAAALASSSRFARAKGPSGDPWPRSALVEPAVLAKELGSPGRSLHILCVTFPFLYEGKHIPQAQFAGPASKPEGIAKLEAAVRNLPKGASIVIYCGCCPMKKCPNIRPAYRTLQKLGFERVRVLDLPSNFHADWVLKGYPAYSSVTQP